MAATLGGASFNSSTSTTGLTVTVMGVSAGSCLAVMINQQTAYTGGYDVSDDVDGTGYILDIEKYANSNRGTLIYRRNNVTGGNTQVTIAPSDAKAKFIAATVVWVAGAGASPTVLTSSFANLGTNPKYAADASGLDVTAGGIVLATFTWNFSATSHTLGTGYSATNMYNSPNSFPYGVSMYREFASDESGHRPSVTLGDALRQGPAASIFIAGAAGASFSAAWVRSRQQVIGGGLI